MKAKTLLFTICIVLFSLSLISAVSIKDVSSLPDQVEPGEIASITIEIENIFERDIFNLNVKLDLSESPFAPYQSSSEKFVEELEEDEEEKFTFRLIVLPSTSSGIYKVPVQINYEDEDGNKSEKTELISITVNAEPELKISVEDSSALIRGSENSFSLKIINSGLADVKFVYFSVGDVNGINFLSEKEQYIGDIDSDDYDSVDYRIYLDENAQAIINLPVTLKFRDATNQEFVETKTVTLKTYSLKEAQALGLAKKPNYLVYVVIVFVIVGFIIRRLQKKRKKKKNHK
ncbi:MAG: hypothetical protein KJ949_00585 [Nanoarchaeota archaeon]|nr:hypothetical protein [Nanoarchaeota archaeon]